MTRARACRRAPTAARRERRTGEKRRPKQIGRRRAESDKAEEEYYIDLKEAPGARPIMAIQYDNKDYAIAWAYERPESPVGRSFAFVGGHFHNNFGVPQFRQAVVNGILWTAQVDVPQEGAPNRITPEDMKLTPPK